MDRPLPMSKDYYHWRGCISKRAFLTKSEADAHRLRINADDPELQVYHCLYGNHFHVGHPKGGIEPKETI